MGDHHGKPVDPESVVAPSAAPLQPSAIQAETPADQAHVAADQAPAPEVQGPVLATPVPALLDPSNDLDAEEKEVFACQEIANLLDIDRYHPIHKRALKDWERREKYLSDRESRREGRSAEATNQIYNIFGWFAVFQGVVLTAVSQLTQTARTEDGGAPLCEKIWFPIVLSGFATVATIVGIHLKLTTLESLEKTIHSDREAKTEVAKRALRLRTKGPQNFKFHLDTNNSREKIKPKSYRKYQVLMIAFLLVFTFIFIISYFVILCDTWVDK